MDKYEMTVRAHEEKKQLAAAVKELTHMDMERARKRALLVRHAEQLHAKYSPILEWDELAEIFGVSRITLIAWRKEAAVVLGGTK